MVQRRSPQRRRRTRVGRGKTSWRKSQKRRSHRDGYGFPFLIPRGWRGIRPGWEDYDVRDALLGDLGFADYRSYLRSPLWAEIRHRCLGRSRYRCTLCWRSQASQVHHVAYTQANLSGASQELLMPVCRPCHKRVEFFGGRKRAPQDVALASGLFKRCRTCDCVKPTRGWAVKLDLCPSCCAKENARNRA